MSAIQDEINAVITPQFNQLSSEIKKLQDLIAQLQAPDTSKRLSVKDAASHFKCSQATIYNKIKAGTLSSEGEGKTLRIIINNIN